MTPAVPLSLPFHAPASALADNIRVVSKRRGGLLPGAGETVVDIDRTNPALGNPHILRDHRDDAERARVIAKYEADLADDLALNGPMTRAIRSLAERLRSGERIALRCWCAPRPCHGDRLRTEIIRCAESLQS